MHSYYYMLEQQILTSEFVYVIVSICTHEPLIIENRGDPGFTWVYFGQP